MAQACFFGTNGLPLPELSGVAAQWFQSQGFGTYVYTDPIGRIFVDAHKESLGRSIFGLSLALTVAFSQPQEGQMLVEFGGGIWGDKLVSGAVGLLFFQPLLVTSIVGAWQQSRLDDNVSSFLNTYIYQRTGRFPTYAPAIPLWQNQGIATPPPPPSNYYQTGYAPQGLPSTQWPEPGFIPPRASWFDVESAHQVFFATYSRMPTWQAAIADGAIQPEEIKAQEKLIAELHGQAEVNLSSPQRMMLNEIMADMDALEHKMQ
jgi:hypothetical protein